MIEKLNKLLSANIIVLIYGMITLGIELLSLIFFDCSPNIKHPVYPTLLWLSIILLLLLLKSDRLKSIYSFFFLVIQCLIIIASNYLFLSNGTTFERSMLKQRNDAYATIEQFYVTPELLFLCAVVIASYLIFLIVYQRKCRKKGNLQIRYKKSYRRAAIAISIFLLASLKMIPMLKTSSNTNIGYESIL